MPCVEYSGTRCQSGCRGPGSRDDASGETIDSGVIQFLYALYSPISRRDIYLQRKFVRDEIKKGRALLEARYPQPRNLFNRFRYHVENARLTRRLISAEKKHVIPPQKLLANASRRESAFLCA